jgi:hypothetical protein
VVHVVAYGLTCRRGARDRVELLGRCEEERTAPSAPMTAAS